MVWANHRLAFYPTLRLRFFCSYIYRRSEGASPADYDAFIVSHPWMRGFHDMVKRRRSFSLRNDFNGWRTALDRESHIIDISHVIQLAVAPVFLLTAVATLITALNSRLGRIVDRRRAVQDGRPSRSDAQAVQADTELRLLSRRAKLIYFAILAAVIAALLVCLVVAGAFLGALLSVDLAEVVAVFFILAMFALIGCLGLFLREVFLAVASGGHIIR